jgi:predicted enzyme related to lactoylglutathione lyase
MNLGELASPRQRMKGPGTSEVVHVELHTGDLAHARSFYQQLLGWGPVPIQSPCGAYLALDLGHTVGGGIVQCPTPHPLWLPYVNVERIGDVTERARALGARVLLEPREGPSGWRSVVAAPWAGEIAFWEAKR